jgi:hypothetical protein
MPHASETVRNGLELELELELELDFSLNQIKQI